MYFIWTRSSRSRDFVTFGINTVPFKKQNGFVRDFSQRLEITNQSNSCIRRLSEIHNFKHSKNLRHKLFKALTHSRRSSLQIAWSKEKKDATCKNIWLQKSASRHKRTHPNRRQKTYEWKQAAWGRGVCYWRSHGKTHALKPCISRITISHQQVHSLFLLKPNPYKVLKVCLEQLNAYTAS